MPSNPDPLALIIGAGGAIISALALIVWSMLLSQVKQLRSEIREHGSHLSGSTGLFPRLTSVEGRLATHDAEIAALKAGTLSREIFERATKEQNEKLSHIDSKVEMIDRTMRPTAWGKPVA